MTPVPIVISGVMTDSGLLLCDIVFLCMRLAEGTRQKGGDSPPYQVVDKLTKNEGFITSDSLPFNNLHAFLFGGYEREKRASS